MFIVRKTAKVGENKKDQLECYDRMHGYVAALLKNGNAYGEPYIYITDKAVVAIFCVPALEALDKDVISNWARQERQAIHNICDEKLNISLEKDHAARNHCLEFAEEECFYLFTNAFSILPPLATGSDGSPVPSYVLPLSEADREAIFAWQKAYRRLDNIWLESGEMEQSAFFQLANLSSELSQNGIKICQTLEDNVGKPVYYFIITGGNGLDSQCPKCKSDWYVRDELPTRTGIEWFDYRCEKCRLVSLTSPF